MNRKLLNILLLTAAVTAGVFIIPAANAASIKVVPSSTDVNPGETFRFDVVVEDIPEQGLGTVQFRLRVGAQGGVVKGINDILYARPSEIDVITPLAAGAAPGGGSGLGDFFLLGKGPSGILLMDNEQLSGGSALYSFSHTSGSTPSHGSGTLASFSVFVGNAVTAENISITLEDVVLLEKETVYLVDSNTGALVNLKCYTTVPDMSGMSAANAASALIAAKLTLGLVNEVANHNGSLELHKVLAQQHAAGTKLECQSSVSLTINEPPAELSGSYVSDKAGDESGAVMVGWDSPSSDTVSVRVYLGETQLVQSDASSSMLEINGLTNGVQTSLRLVSVDAFGNESTGVLIQAVAVDDIAPRIDLAGVSSGGVYNSNVYITPVIEDAGTVMLTILLDGQPYGGSAISGEGLHTISTTAQDDAGNLATAEWIFTIDISAPVITIVGLEDGKYYNHSVTPGITISDTSDINATITLDGAAYSAGSSIFEEGTHIISVTAYDLAGNATTVVLGFAIDLTAPVSTASISGAYSSGNAVFVSPFSMITLASGDSGEVRSGIDRMEYSIDGGEWIIYETGLALPPTEGNVNLRYRAVDIAGNMEQARSLDVVLDMSAPTAEIAAGEPYYISGSELLHVKSTTIINVTSSDTLSGVFSLMVSVDGGPWLSTTQFSLISDGAHEIRVLCMDNSGNESEYSKTVIVDDTAPVTAYAISGANYASDDGSLYLGSGATLRLISSDELSGTAYMEYSLDDVTWHVYEPIPVTSESISFIAYRSTDMLGNVEEIRRINLNADTTAPVTSLRADGAFYVSSDRLYAAPLTVFVLDAFDSGSGIAVTKYRINGGDWITGSSPVFAYEGLYALQWESADNVGNLESTMSRQIYIDATAPVVEISLSGIVYTAVGGLTYGGADSGFKAHTSDTGSGISWLGMSVDGGQWEEYSETAFNTEGMHYVRFMAVDNVGNISETADYVIVTDTTSPSLMIAYDGANLSKYGTTYLGSGTMISLSADEQSAGLDRIEYSVDGEEWKVYGGAFSIPKQGPHSLDVRAFDNVGNGSSLFEVALFIDDAAPVSSIAAGAPSFANGMLYVKSSTLFTIGSLDSGSGVAHIYCSIDGGEWTEYAPFAITDGGLHQVSFKAVDALGNSEAMQTIAAFVDDTPPVLTLSLSAQPFSLSAADVGAGIRSANCRIDGGTWDAYIGEFWVMGDGMHTVECEAVDNLGNSSSSLVKVAVDNTAPVTVVSYNIWSESPVYGVVVTGRTLISLSSADGYSGIFGVYYRIDGGEWASYATPIPVTGLAPGMHTVDFYAVDNNGNTESVVSTGFMYAREVDVNVEVSMSPRVLVWVDDAARGDSAAEFVSEALAGHYLSIVRSKDDFVSRLRSGLYNIFTVIGNDTPVDANVRREIREATYSGAGLLVSAWGNNVHPIIADALGIKFSGSQPMSDSVRSMSVLESPLSEQLILDISGRVLRVESAGGSVVATVEETKQGKGKPASRSAAIVLNEYGLGRTVFFGFDLSASVGSFYAGLLKAAVEYATPSNHASGHGAVILLKTTIAPEEGGMTVLALDSLGGGLECLNLFGLECGDLAFEIVVSKEQPGWYSYFVNVPISGGPFTKSTTIHADYGSGYVELGTFNFTLAVDSSIESSLDAVSAWAQEALGLYPDKASGIADFYAIVSQLPSASPASIYDAEIRINRALEAIEVLLGLGGDVSSPRAALYEYIRKVSASYAAFEAAEAVK